MQEYSYFKNVHISTDKSGCKKKKKSEIKNV